jgi:hypothetical protein
MKEIGLLFTPENLRLIPPGIKTQTRRGNGLEDIPGDANFIGWGVKGQPGVDGDYACFDTKQWGIVQVRCPYGVPQFEQTMYYSREAVQVLDIIDGAILSALIRYTNDGAESKVIITPDDYHKLVSRANWKRKTTGMHMLKSFARTRLPGVRTWPERLGDMSTGDAIAEGIELDSSIHPFEESQELRHQYRVRPVWRDYLSGGYDLTPIQSYASLWNSINGETHPWAPDLWTWCIEFQFQPPATGNPG